MNKLKQADSKVADLCQVKVKGEDMTPILYYLAQAALITGIIYLNAYIWT